eukprot:m.97636 g.97636  ORF g.97636 m.97636 type:complete len:984 (+) comp36946_c0_seq4:1214-4165(+)
MTSRQETSAKLSNLLLVAASRGMDQDVRRLLNQGAPFGRDWLGRSALHLAAGGGHSEVIRVLIAAGCDIDRRDQVSCTALHRAVVGDNSAAAVKALLAGGCKVDLQDEHGSTALHEAAWSGNYRVVRLLVKARCNVNVRNQAGFTALHLAAQNGHVKAVQELINGGADIQALNDYGDTPLHVSTRYGHLEIARRLVKAGCSLDTFNKEGLTPIHITAQVGMLQIAELLIDSGCNLSMQTKDCMTAVGLATRYRNRECARLLTRAMQAGPMPIPPTPYGMPYGTRNETRVRRQARQRHHSDESETREMDTSAGHKTRRRRSGSLERNDPNERAMDVVRIDYPATPYYESDENQAVAAAAAAAYHRSTGRYQAQTSRQWILRSEDDDSQGRESLTSASSTGASSTGASSGRGYRSASSERSKGSGKPRSGEKKKRSTHVQRDSQRPQPEAPAPYKEPPPYAAGRQGDRPSPRSSQSPLVDQRTIRVHHPFKGSNRPTNPFKKPPNLFFVSFEDPEPIEDACRLSDIGGRPYVPPSRNMAKQIHQSIVSKRIEEEQFVSNGDHQEERRSSDQLERDDDPPSAARSSLSSSGDCSSPGANRTSFSPKPGCLKQKCSGSTSTDGGGGGSAGMQKRVAFDIPMKESMEERKTGDGAQTEMMVLVETNGLTVGDDSDGGDDEKAGLDLKMEGLSSADDHGTRVATLRMRHSSLPESQQFASPSARGSGDGKGKGKGKLSTLKALKKFVLSRHSKSALKKRMNETAVMSLDKSGAGTFNGGSAVQSSTSLQRSASVRLNPAQRPNNPAEGVTGSPSVIRRGGRHNSEVLSRSRSFFRSSRPQSKTTDELPEMTALSPPPTARLSASRSPSSLSSESAESVNEKDEVLPPDVEQPEGKRESLVSGEDGADSVESPCEADKEYQVDALIAVEKAKVERRCEVKTAVEVATIEQRYQTKLMEIERHCEAKATAKEVELQAKIRQLEEQLVATKW